MAAKTEKLFCWGEKMNILKKIYLRGGMALGILYPSFQSRQEIPVTTSSQNTALLAGLFHEEVDNLVLLWHEIKYIFNVSGGMLSGAALLMIYMHIDMT